MLLGSVTVTVVPLEIKALADCTTAADPVVPAGLTIIVALLLEVSCGEPESVTVPVKLKVPAVVGVPVMAPVLAFSVSPGGKEPELMANVYGLVPPLAANDEL